MSKSLGTGVDPLDLMETTARTGCASDSCSRPPAQDIRFAEDKLEASRNFANKIWNASRFVLMNMDDEYEPGDPDVRDRRRRVDPLAALGVVGGRRRGPRQLPVR